MISGPRQTAGLDGLSNFKIRTFYKETIEGLLEHLGYSLCRISNVQASSLFLSPHLTSSNDSVRKETNSAEKQQCRGSNGSNGSPHSFKYTNGNGSLADSNYSIGLAGGDGSSGCFNREEETLTLKACEMGYPHT